MKTTDQWLKKTILFLASQAVSLFGSSIVGFAMIRYISLETGSASQMAITIICSFLPQVLIAPIAGVWADRYDRKRIALFADLFTAVVTLALALLWLRGATSLIFIYVLSALRSLGAGVQAPAVSAILPSIVPQQHLTRVNGINMAVHSALTILSPALGGVLLGSLGFVYTLFTDAITASIAIIILAVLKLNLPKHEPQSQGAFEDVKVGMRYVRDHAFLGRLFIVYTLFFFLIAPAAFLTPILLQRVFGTELWYLTANEMTWSIGTLIGGIVVSVWGGFKNRLTTMALATVGFGAAFALMGVASNFILYLVFLLTAGFFLPLFNTAQIVLVQETVEEKMLGRVFAIAQLISSTVMPLAMVFFGPLGDRMSIQLLLVITGICLVGLAPMILRVGKNATQTKSPGCA